MRWVRGCSVHVGMWLGHGKELRGHELGRVCDGGPWWADDSRGKLPMSRAEQTRAPCRRAYASSMGSARRERGAWTRGGHEDGERERERDCVRGELAWRRGIVVGQRPVKGRNEFGNGNGGKDVKDVSIEHGNDGYDLGEDFRREAVYEDGKVVARLGPDRDVVEIGDPNFDVRRRDDVGVAPVFQSNTLKGGEENVPNREQPSILDQKIANGTHMIGSGYRRQSPQWLAGDVVLETT
ncbi:hypothetical protein OF83DRAFT_1089283 [Amylostereum chailletii]|nr:hypothetical protein OF83DRAFT_1089283 [Amylostereum chailletii]